MRLVANCLMGFIALVGAIIIMPLAVQADGTHAGKHHMNITGTVTEVKSGILTGQNTGRDAHAEREYDTAPRP